MDNSVNQDDAREQLLLRLYTDGVIGLDEARYWAHELNLSPDGQRRLMMRCIQAHFDVPGDLLAA